MNRFGFVVVTLIVGGVAQFFCQRYLSLASAAPDVLLLLTAALGFAGGPIMGQVFGFCWGIMADAAGTELFGISAFNLTLVGFLAGAFRRRVASERVTAQLVIGFTGTLLQALVGATVLSAFDSAGRTAPLELIVESAMNVIFVPWIFLATERWLEYWNVEREHI